MTSYGRMGLVLEGGEEGRIGDNVREKPEAGFVGVDVCAVEIRSALVGG